MREAVAADPAGRFNDVLVAALSHKKPFLI